MVSEATTRKQEDGPARVVSHYTYQGLAGLRDSTCVSEESWPYLVSAFAGVVGVGIASLVGAAELAVGVAAAYVAYDVIARGVTLWDAIREVAIREVEKKIDVE